MTTVSIVFAALLLDRWLGEPNRRHPLVGFGRLTLWLERRWLDGGLQSTAAGDNRTRLTGTLAVLLLVIPLPGLLWLLFDNLPANDFTAIKGLTIVLELAGLYLCLGRKSLVEHAEAIARPLAVGDLAEARRRTGYIVSRDVDALDQAGMSRAAIESVLENGNDACFATLFWFLVGGLPLAVLHRLVNTLDAMWGYKNQRYLQFGWAAARLDDLLGWLPARLTALSYALVGQSRNSLHCWSSQAPQHDSPNAGPVISAGAGALNIRVGGAAQYHGQLKPRPIFGSGAEASQAGIGHSVRLLNRSVGLWLAVLVSAALLPYILR